MKKRSNKTTNNILNSLKEEEKIIVFDGGHYSHTAIYSFIKNRFLPIGYTYLNMIGGDLKRIYNNNDIIIIAIDKGKSWRKLIDGEYKANRKKIDKSYWEEINKINDILNLYTPIHVIGDWGYEADDIMAVVSKVYKDKKVLLVSADSDIEQLTYYDNVFLFSPKTKRFKDRIKDVEGFILKKIKKEVTDNLIAPIITVEDRIRRESIVSLLKLPEGVEESIKKMISVLPKKNFIEQKIPFRKMREKFKQIFT